MQPTRLGEVVEASTAGFVAQCYRLGEPPPLGSLVRTSDGEVEIYAVVCNAFTGSIDPGRRFTALGGDEPAQEDIYRSHPELTQLLRTDFEGLVVGFREGQAVRQHLPPRPASIHGFVYAVTDEEVRAFTGSLHFLYVLLGAAAPTRDEALAACLRLASRAHAGDGAFLERAGKELARLLPRDTPRLNALLRMVRA